jgi:hypothetical protein
MVNYNKKNPKIPPFLYFKIEVKFGNNRPYEEELQRRR